MELMQRLWLIELLAYWEGRSNTTSISQYFGLSRQQASADFKAYNEQAPGNLHYHASSKAYLPSCNFVRRFITDDVAEYLNWMQFPKISLAAPAKAHLPSLSLGLPARTVTPVIMRALVAAIRQQKRLDVDYVSLNNPNREGRIIAPHTFVSTGLRWHLRAWCEKSQGYRDFVLSRFRGEPDLLDKTTHTNEQDTGWNTEVTLILQPDPRLPPEKRAVLEHDYQMQDGQLRVATRACLVNYLLREMQINTKMLDGTPEAQQLVLVNVADIKPWLFEG